MNHETAQVKTGNGREKSWVIVRAGDGFKVYTPSNPTTFHTVRTQPLPSCTCEEHNRRSGKPVVTCEHITAVLTAQGGRFGSQPLPAISPATRPSGSGASERGASPAPDDAARQMLLKRSISPDGRIDSLSIEFSLPVAKLSTSDIKASASKALALQSEIVESFLGKRGNGSAPNADAEKTDETLYARIRGVEAMDTKWGRRFYLNFSVNNERMRLFGSPRRLGEILTIAGHPEYSRRITEGMEFDLPCRVVVEPSSDGRYMNVRQVFPTKSDRR